MGGCFCFPVSYVTENPAVAMYTECGKGVFMHLQSRIVMESSFFNGMVYVIGDRIYYNSKYGDTFWCPCIAGIERFVADIRNIEVVTGNFTVFNSNGFNRELNMNPGLRITFKDNAALLVTMPDAVNFSLQLRQYQSNSISRGRMGFSHVPHMVTTNPVGTQHSIGYPTGPPSLFENSATTQCVDTHSETSYPPANQNNEDSEKAALLAKTT